MLKTLTTYVRRRRDRYRQRRVGGDAEQHSDSDAAARRAHAGGVSRTADQRRASYRVQPHRDRGQPLRRKSVHFYVDARGRNTTVTKYQYLHQDLFISRSHYKTFAFHR